MRVRNVFSKLDFFFSFNFFFVLRSLTRSGIRYSSFIVVVHSSMLFINSDCTRKNRLIKYDYHNSSTLSSVNFFFTFHVQHYWNIYRRRGVFYPPHVLPTTALFVPRGRFVVWYTERERIVLSTFENELTSLCVRNEFASETTLNDWRQV